ncbi:hypothetical protein KY290_005512 [Solanum tuberosum]|uniref:Uncharacterized protein n=1 Tax=Solanum tuberosum TaxID=4113 RepID=A0ABQ7WGH1_SOLTU|nr:hypothetical protein KY290_005512 [Solanum tuberosum]
MLGQFFAEKGVEIAGSGKGEDAGHYFGHCCMYCLLGVFRVEKVGRVGSGDLGVGRLEIEMGWRGFGLNGEKGQN